MPKTKLFIDALSIVPQRMSGVGHNTLELIRALDSLPQVQENHQIILIVPLWKRKALARHGFSRRIKIKTVFLPARVMEILLRLHLMPPVDLFLGRGDYLFPNYRNWPLIRSKSYTYFHDVVFMRHPEFVRPRNLNYLRRYSRGWVKRSYKIITLSEFSKKEISHFFSLPPAKIAVVPCGVDAAVFYPRSKEEVEQAKAKYGIAARHYVLYLGNIEPRKNLVRLIGAFRKLPTDLKQDYSLVLIGADSWLSEPIYHQIDKAREAGLMIEKPEAYVEDEDLPALITGADCLVQVALYEGFGISPLQAMACGAPVVCSDSSSLPEVADKAALLVDPLDEAGISDSLRRVISDKPLGRRLTRVGHERAELFSWQAAAVQLYKVLSDHPK